MPPAAWRSSSRSRPSAPGSSDQGFPDAVRPAAAEARRRQRRLAMRRMRWILATLRDRRGHAGARHGVGGARDVEAGDDDACGVPRLRRRRPRRRRQAVRRRRPELRRIERGGARRGVCVHRRRRTGSGSPICRRRGRTSPSCRSAGSCTRWAERAPRSNPRAEAWSYDLATNRWHAIAPLPAPRTELHAWSPAAGSTRSADGTAAG